MPPTKKASTKKQQADDEERDEPNHETSHAHDSECHTRVSLT